MSTKLRAVEKQDGPDLGPDFTKQPGEWHEPAAADFNNDITGDAAADEFADAVAGALQANLNDNKTLIQRTRAWAEEQLAHVTKQEEQLQIKLAAADAALDERMKAAQAERDAIVADIALDLRQVTALRAAVAIFKGELVKAEL